MPWPVALPSAAAKLARARDHARQLTREADAFRDSRPYQVVQDRDPDTGEWRTRAVVTRQPPASMGPILGDAVHNLRSSLDHAIFALSVAHQARELTEDEQRRPTFPICRAEREWPKAVSSDLALVSDPARDQVRRLQPFLRPEDERSWDVLACLSDLDNADKHRSLLLTASAVQIFGAAVADELGGQHRFTRAVEAGGSFVSRLPGDADPAGAQITWDVYVRLDPAGPVRCVPLEEDEIDRVVVGWASRVEYFLSLLANDVCVNSEVIGG